MNKLKLIFIIFGCLSAGIVIGNLITDNDAITEKQQKLIDLQSNMIDSLTNHLWFEHDCELGICDGDILDSIHTIEQELDELYNK
jgi:hypothetical protein